jgi:hypothetical protein
LVSCGCHNTGKQRRGVLLGKVILRAIKLVFGVDKNTIAAADEAGGAVAA